MIEISFISLELVFTGIWLLIRLFVWVRQGHISLKYEAAQALMYINLAVIIRFVFFPRELADGHIQPLVFDSATAFPFRVNFVPLVHLLEYSSARDIIWNVAGNAAMFIPSGIVLPIAYRQLNSFAKVVAAGAFISFCIEVIQLPFPQRASDIDDLIMNTLGVIVGYGIYAAVRGLRRKVIKHKHPA